MPPHVATCGLRSGKSLRRRLVLVGVLCSAAVMVGARQAELTVDAPPEFAGMAARVRAMDGASFAAPLRRAGLDLPRRVRVTLVPETDLRARVTPGWVAGQAFSTDVIFVFPQRISSYPHDSVESVVRHELVHLALSVRARNRPLPRWFHEGVAVSVESGWNLATQARLLWAAAREPAVEDVNSLFQSATRPEATTAYLLAAALVEDIRQRHGGALPGAIAGRVAAGASFDDAFKAETGESVQQAASRAWGAYRGWTRWLPIATGPFALWGLILALAGVAFIARRRRRAARRRRWDDEEAEDFDRP
jgi:hypothetical protein